MPILTACETNECPALNVKSKIIEFNTISENKMKTFQIFEDNNLNESLTIIFSNFHDEDQFNHFLGFMSCAETIYLNEPKNSQMSVEAKDILNIFEDFARLINLVQVKE